MEKYERVLELMKQKGGRLSVEDPDLKTLLGEVYYRYPTYFSFIRKKANLPVRGVREGRKVVAYEIVAVTEPESAEVPSATV